MSLKAYREINKQPEASDRLKLALVFIVGFGGIGTYQAYVKHHELASHVLWALAVALPLLCLIPPLGRLLYIGWMGLGVTMGMLTQPVFLFVTYVVFFIPLGLVFRLLSRDTMKRKLVPRDDSYWEDYVESDDKSSYFKQY